MASYGTPGQSDCTDLNFCASLDDEARVRTFFKASAELINGLTSIRRQIKNDNAGAELLNDGPELPPGWQHPGAAAVEPAQAAAQNPPGSNPKYANMLRIAASSR